MRLATENNVIATNPQAPAEVGPSVPPPPGAVSSTDTPKPQTHPALVPTMPSAGVPSEPGSGYIRERTSEPSTLTAAASVA